MASDTDNCIVCGQPATHLCDYQIGTGIAGYERVGAVGENRFRAVSSLETPFFTCDAPLCDACKSNKGFMHASGRAGFTETVDHCPIHAAAGHQELSPPMLPEEAERIRRAVLAQYRRQSLAVHSCAESSVRDN